MTGGGTGGERSVVESLSLSTVREDIVKVLSDNFRDGKMVRLGDNLGDIFRDSSTGAALGQNAAALEFADAISKKYGLPMKEFERYDPKDINVGLAVNLIYVRLVSGGQV